MDAPVGVATVGLAGRAAVIGGTGFIGSHLVCALLARGAEVLVVARSDDRERERDGAGASTHDDRRTFVDCDILDGVRLRDILTRFRPRVVYHLACHPDGAESAAHAASCVRVNTLGSVTVFESARVAGASRLIFADSFKVYGSAGTPANTDDPVQPNSSYGASKAAAWQILRLLADSGPPDVVSLRLTMVYGPRQNWNLIRYVLECARKREPVALMGGDQTRGPVWVGDVVDAFLRAAEVPDAAGRAIPISGAEELSAIAISQAVLHALGSDVAVHAHARPPRPTEIQRSFADGADARACLGWTPRVSFREGLQRMLAADAGEASDAPDVITAASSPRSGLARGGPA